jgi:hypothetical protein
VSERVRKGAVERVHRDVSERSFSGIELGSRAKLSFLVRHAVLKRVQKDLFPEWSLAATLRPGLS